MPPAPSPAGPSRTPSGRIPKPADAAAAKPAGAAGNPGTRRIAAPAPGAPAAPARGGTQRIAKPGAASAASSTGAASAASSTGAAPAASSTGAASAANSSGGAVAPVPRPSGAIRASSRLQRVAPATPPGEGPATADDGAPKRGADYYFKLGALASIPVLLVLLAGIYWWKVSHAPDPGDPNAGKPEIKKEPVKVDAIAEFRALIDHGFDLRKEAVTTGDPVVKKKKLEEAQDFFTRGLKGYKRRLAEFPGAEFGLADEVSRIEGILAAVDKELNPPKDDTSKKPKDFEEAEKTKTEASKKYGAVFDTQDMDERKTLLLEAISLAENAKKTFKRVKESADDTWKRQAEQAINGCDSFLKTCNEELDRTNAKVPETPPDAPGGSGDAPPGDGSSGESTPPSGEGGG